MPKKKPNTTNRSISPLLEELRLEYPDRAELMEDAVYALPEELIIALKNEGIFNEEDVEFEMDLRGAGGSFFLGQQFSYLSLFDEVTGPEESALDAEFESAVSSIKQMLADDRIEAGFDAEEVNSAFRSDDETNAKILERRHGFTGWLVTSQEFRSQREPLMNDIQDDIERLGRFPPYHPSMMGEAPRHPEMDAHAYRRLMDFYSRWNLDRMITWDLPKPMRPQWTAASGYYLPQIDARAGLVVFVPWYLLRNNDLKIEDIVDRNRVISSPPELRDWVESKEKNWNSVRYATMLKIYVYLELVLKRRYVSQIKNNLARFDAALSSFLTSDGDKAIAGIANIEKIRQKMSRRIKRKK